MLNISVNLEQYYDQFQVPVVMVTKDLCMIPNIDRIVMLDGISPDSAGLYDYNDLIKGNNFVKFKYAIPTDEYVLLDKLGNTLFKCTHDQFVNLESEFVQMLKRVNKPEITIKPLAPVIIGTYHKHEERYFFKPEFVESTEYNPIVSGMITDFKYFVKSVSDENDFGISFYSVNHEDIYVKDLYKLISFVQRKLQSFKSKQRIVYDKTYTFNDLVSLYETNKEHLSTLWSIVEPREFIFRLNGVKFYFDTEALMYNCINAKLMNQIEDFI